MDLRHVLILRLRKAVKNANEVSHGFLYAWGYWQGRASALRGVLRDLNRKSKR